MSRLSLQRSMYSMQQLITVDIPYVAPSAKLIDGIMVNGSGTRRTPLFLLLTLRRLDLTLGEIVSEEKKGKKKRVSLIIGHISLFKSDRILCTRNLISSTPILGLCKLFFYFRLGCVSTQWILHSTTCVLIGVDSIIGSLY